MNKKNTSVLQQFAVFFTNAWMGYVALAVGTAFGSLVTIGLYRTIHITIPKMVQNPSWFHIVWTAVLVIISLGGLVYSGWTTYGKFKEITGNKYAAFALMIYIELNIAFNPDFVIAIWGVVLMDVLQSLAFGHRLLRTFQAQYEVANAKKKPVRAKQSKKTDTSDTKHTHNIAVLENRQSLSAHA